MQAPGRADYDLWDYLKKLVRLNYQESYEKICKLPLGGLWSLRLFEKVFKTNSSEVLWKNMQAPGRAGYDLSE